MVFSHPVASKFLLTKWGNLLLPYFDPPETYGTSLQASVKMFPDTLTLKLVFLVAITSGRRVIEL